MSETLISSITWQTGLMDHEKDCKGWPLNGSKRLSSGHYIYIIKIDVNEKLGVGVSDCLFLTTFFLSLLIYLALK